MKIQQLANDTKSNIIITFEGVDSQIEIVLGFGEAEKLADLLTVEIQELLRARANHIYGSCYQRGADGEIK